MTLTLVWWPKRNRASSNSASRTDRTVTLTDQQWNLIADLFRWTPPAAQGGRPRIHPRDCLEGILWVLVAGARWKDLPKAYPSKATCHRRFVEWMQDGRLLKLWQRLLKITDAQTPIDLSETFADGTFSSAKKGANALARRVVARGRRS